MSLGGVQALSVVSVSNVTKANVCLSPALTRSWLPSQKNDKNINKVARTKPIISNKIVSPQTFISTSDLFVLALVAVVVVFTRAGL